MHTSRGKGIPVVAVQPNHGNSSPSKICFLVTKATKTVTAVSLHFTAQPRTQGGRSEQNQKSKEEEEEEEEAAAEGKSLSIRFSLYRTSFQIKPGTN